MTRIIGIVGGMGPMATCDLFRKMIEETDAARDQDHVHVIIDNNTEIPDRTEALLHGGPSPTPQIIASCRRLEKAGAQALLMPCNTAHAYYDEITREIKTPFLNMIWETVREVRRRSLRRVGLLATDGTLASRVYQRGFEGSGVALITPDPQDQAHLMELIYRGIKGGDPGVPVEYMTRPLAAMVSGGCEAVILGCTELPIAVERYGIAGPLLDPTRILARAAVAYAGARLKKHDRDEK